MYFGENVRNGRIARLDTEHGTTKKAIAFFSVFEYTEYNRVARSFWVFGDQAENCTQLSYIKGRIILHLERLIYEKICSQEKEIN